MADDEAKPEGEPEAKKGGLPIKLVIIIAAAMLIEALAIGAVFFMAGGPAPVEATELEDDLMSDAMKEVEIPVVADKFMNTRRGIPYTYDVEVVIKVQNRYNEDITLRVEELQNTLRDDVARNFRQAEPAHLMEADLLTIKRQLKDALNERFGMDDEGEYYVLEVLVPKFQQYRSDG